MGIDRRFVDADLRIAVGLVEPHFMAGYSGGRKIVAPGVAHEKTIRTFHSARVLEHCRAVNCVIEGNPLHEAQLEIVRMIGKCLALNTVIDEERRLSFVNFGEIEASHLEAVAFVRPYAEVPMKKRFRTVVTSSAGYPLDKTYYQTVKGMVGALEILEPGGTLVTVSKCSEGVGSKEYAEAQRSLIRLGPERFLQEILPKRYAAIDEWQAEMQVKAMKKGKVCLYSEGLSKEQQIPHRRFHDRLTRCGRHGEREGLRRSPRGRHSRRSLRDPALCGGLIPGQAFRKGDHRGGEPPFVFWRPHGESNPGYRRERPVS